MTIQLLLALFGFAFASSITPGPNNMMVLASGANFGVRATWPHMLGICTGIATMCALIGLFLMSVFDRWPILRDLLTLVSILYMLWLCLKIAQAGTPQAAQAGARPMPFFAALAFQWINPKAWISVMSGVTIYAPGGNTGAVLAVAAVFGLVALPCVLVWTLMGNGLRNWLMVGRRLRMFNIAMALLLAGSMAPVVLGLTGA